MHDAGLVGGFQALGDRAGGPQRLLDVERSAFDSCCQVLTGHVLHGDETYGAVFRLGFVQPVHRGDVRVIQ